MRDRATERMSGLTFVLSCLSMLIWIMAALPVNYAVDTISAAVLPMALISGGLYLLESLLIERECRMDLLIILHVICMAAGILLFRQTCTFSPGMPAVKLFFSAAYGICLTIGLFIAWDPIKPSTVIACFDWMAVLLILHMALKQISMALLTTQTTAVCAAAMAFSLAAMMKIRLKRTGASGASVGNAETGKLFSVFAIILIGALAVLLTAALSGMLHGVSEGMLMLLRTAGAAVLSGIGMLYRVLERFLLWLSQWFQEDLTLDGLDTETAAQTESETIQLTAAEIPLWFYVLLAAAAAVLIFLFFRKIRGHRMKNHMTAAVYADAQYTGGIREALAAWFSHVKKRILFRIRYFRRKKTPAGMLIYCERHFRHSCPRFTGESGGAYLRRLGDYTASLKQDEKAAQEAGDVFRELAHRIEQVFYAPPGCAASQMQDEALFHRLRASLRST